MRIVNIELDSSELPATVTVVMSAAEAAFIAVACGAYTDRTADSAAPEFSHIEPRPHHSVYDALVGAVFNRFYDDGIADAVRDIASRGGGTNDTGLRG